MIRDNATLSLSLFAGNERLENTPRWAMVSKAMLMATYWTHVTKAGVGSCFISCLLRTTIDTADKTDTQHQKTATYTPGSSHWCAISRGSGLELLESGVSLARLLMK